MLAVRVDEKLRITWMSDGEVALGRVRLGGRLGEFGILGSAAVVELGRRVKRAMLTQRTLHFTSPLGAVLLVPCAGGAVLYLDAKGFDVGGDADDLGAQRGQVIEPLEDVRDPA